MPKKGSHNKNETFYSKNKGNIWFVSIVFIVTISLIVIFNLFSSSKDELGWNEYWIHTTAKGEVLDEMAIRGINWWTYDWKEISHRELSRGSDYDGDYIRYEVSGIITFKQSQCSDAVKMDFTVELQCYKFDGYI